MLVDGKDILVYLEEMGTQNITLAEKLPPIEKYHVNKKIIHHLIEFCTLQPVEYEIEYVKDVIKIYRFRLLKNYNLITFEVLVFLEE